MGKTGKILRAGASLAALAAVGAYFLHGEKGTRNRRMIRGWALKMKGEVLEKLENAKKIDRDTYLRMVDNVAGRYAKLESISAAELQHLTVELKNAWARIDRNLK